MFYESLGHLLTNYKLGPVYINKNLNETLNITDALKFAKNVKQIWHYKMNLYWTQYEFDFPTFPETDGILDDKMQVVPSDVYKDISFELYEQVLQLGNIWYLNDYVIWLRKAIVSTFYLIENSLDWSRCLLQRPMGTGSTRFPSAQDQWAILMAKDMLMGMYRDKTLLFKTNKSDPGQEIEIARDYEFPDPRDHTKKLKFLSNYSAWLRDKMLTQMLESWNADPKHVNFQRNTLLQTRQLDFLKRRQHRTVCLAVRRAGKSAMMAIDVMCKMLQFNHKKWIRPRTILYLSKDTSTYKTVVDYMDNLVWNMWWMKEFFYYNTKQATYYFRDPFTKEIYAQCKFLTAEWRTPWVGSAADDIIVDEAMMVKYSVRSRLEPIATHEWASVTIVSTFYDVLENWDPVYDWPIRLCNEREKESSKIIDIDSHILKEYDDYINKWIAPKQWKAGLRYTIDDIDVILDKDGIKKMYSVDPDKYMKELYCRAPQKKTLFNYKPYTVQVKYDTTHKVYQIAWPNWVEENIPNHWDLLVIWYDPARTSDMSALVTMGYNKQRKKVSIIREQQLNYNDKSSFTPQALAIVEEMKWCKQHSKNVIMVMDATHPGVAEIMFSNWASPYKWYKWCWWDTIRKWKAVWEWNVPKKLMVEATKFMFDNNMFEVWNTVPLVIDQLDKYVEFVDQRWVSTYQWMNSHDDFVAALMVWAFTLYEDFWFKYWLAKAKAENNDVRPINIFEPKKKSEREEVIPWWPFFKRPKVLDKPIATDTFWY